MNIESKISLILSFGRSLLDEITNSLRAASARVEGSEIHISFFFNCDVTDEMREHYEGAYSEVYAPVPMEVFGSVLFEKRVFPEPLPDLGVYVFSRDTLLPSQIDPNELGRFPLDVRIKIEMYQVLLGRIPATLRAVRFKKTEKEVIITSSFDSDVMKMDIELLRKAVREFRCAFPELVVKEELEIGQDLPQLYDYVFMRCIYRS